MATEMKPPLANSIYMCTIAFTKYNVNDKPIVRK